MNLIEIAAPLVGVILGSALTGVGSHLKARQEHRRVLASALTDLLEVRHRLVAMELVLKKVSSLGGLPKEDHSEFRNALELMIPIDKGLDERYDAAVTLLGGVDPVLAFTLRSSNGLPRALASLRQMAIFHQADLATFEQIEQILHATASPSLDNAPIQLARRHSIFTALAVRRHIQKSVDLPPEIEHLFMSMSTPARH